MKSRDTATITPFLHHTFSPPLPIHHRQRIRRTITTASLIQPDKHHLLYKRRVKDIQEFSQVPLAFRTELQEAGYTVGRSSVHSSVVAADCTIKLLIKLEDNILVETVGIPISDAKGSVRLTACVSSH